MVRHCPASDHYVVHSQWIQQGLQVLLLNFLLSLVSMKKGVDVWHNQTHWHLPINPLFAPEPRFIFHNWSNMTSISIPKTHM